MHCFWQQERSSKFLTIWVCCSLDVSKKGIFVVLWEWGSFTWLDCTRDKLRARRSIGFLVLKEEFSWSHFLFFFLSCQITMVKISFYKYKLSFPGVKDTIMVSLCLYNVHDVSMCVRISLLLQLVSSHLRKIFLLSVCVCFLCYCAWWACLAWQETYTHILVKEHHSSS